MKKRNEINCRSAISWSKRSSKSFLFIHNLYLSLLLFNRSLLRFRGDIWRHWMKLITIFDELQEQINVFSGQEQSCFDFEWVPLMGISNSQQTSFKEFHWATQRRGEKKSWMSINYIGNRFSTVHRQFYEWNLEMLFIWFHDFLCSMGPLEWILVGKDWMLIHAIGIIYRSACAREKKSLSRRQ